MTGSLLGVLGLLTVFLAGCGERGGEARGGEASAPLPSSLLSPAGSVAALAPVTPPLPSPWPPPVPDGDWPAFGRDGGRTASSPAAFATTTLTLAWSYSLGPHAYTYRRGTNVWSESAAAATVGPRTIVAVGAYDRKIHALDAATGERLWRFTTGDEVVATPVLDPTAQPPTCLVASTDRTLYGLDLLTGDRRFVREEQTWAHTASPAVFSSPLLAPLPGGPRLLVGGGFLTDVGRSTRRQEGLLMAWDAASGTPVWSRPWRRTEIHGPAAATVDGRPVLVAAAADGVVAAFDARDGRPAWTFTADDRLRGCPAIIDTAAGPLVLTASRWGMLWGLDARTGAVRISYRAGHQVDSSPAVASLADGRQVAVFGSYDRCVHAVDLTTGRRAWKFETGNVVTCSPAVATMAGRTTVFISSLDDTLYALDAATGDLRWSFRHGPLPWDWIRRGDAVLGSPLICRAGGRTLLIHPAHDGVLYAFADSAP